MIKLPSILKKWLPFAALTIVIIAAIVIYILSKNSDPTADPALDDGHDLESAPLPIPEPDLNPQPKPDDSTPGKKPPSPDFVPETSEVTEARTSLMKKLTANFTVKSEVPSKFSPLMTKYKDEPAYFTENFMETDSTSLPQIRLIASFGISLLSAYANNDKAFKNLRIVEYLIKKVRDFIKTISFTSGVPPGYYEEDYNVLLTRMLSTYEFLGTNEDTKKICRSLITKITSTWFKSLNVSRTGAQLVQTSVPFLINCALFSPEQFKADSKGSSAFSSLKDALAAEVKTMDDTSDGLNFDRSYIQRKIATFLPLINTGDFYYQVLKSFDSLNFPTKLHDVTKELLNEILHPDLDVVPFGLFGPDVVSISETLKYEWPSYRKTSSPGVRIWPAIGLGVFKTEKFVFYVRVQRQEIEPYQSDDHNIKFAAGWIQMRKMFFKDKAKEYPAQYIWDVLRLQPGVTSTDKDNFEDLKTPKEKSSDEVDSHIGFLQPKESTVSALYWKNKYTFRDSKFDEFGVCTADGLVISLEVNNRTSKVLKVATKDPNMPGGMTYECKPKFSDGVVEVGPGATVTVCWRQVFNDNVKLKDIEKVKDERINFKFNSSEYAIEFRDDFHVIQTSGGEPIFAGSPNIAGPREFAQPYGGRDVKFELNKNTFMFEPKK